MRAQLVESSQLPLGVKAYSALIHGHADRGDVAEALRVLDLMAARNVTPNGYTFTAIVSACV